MSNNVKLPSSMSDFIVTLNDFNMAAIKEFNCHTGMRQKAIEYGFSWSNFLTNGIPFSKLADLNDGQINRCLEVILDVRKQQQ